MIKELLLIIIGVAVADAVVCGVYTCLSFECGETTCPPGFRVKYRGGFCGCCNNCVLSLNEGDSCNPVVNIGGRLNHKGVTNSDALCDYGLKCDKNSKTCVKKSKKGTTKQPTNKNQ
ncbi:uncharacterized protein NPIL_439711 [Nephila pilipes]|uniref:Uncharacterized protein n=1 Tax=Nephila pilipes TaxID=299642 RepID=A0A8X6P6I9_NEPPI|nr:uncharacterized protein NPIL_439711 [Nephila pilipes]